MIYRVDDEEHGQWTTLMKKNALLTEAEEEKLEVRSIILGELYFVYRVAQLAGRQTHPDCIIGYVTTGNFSLSLGEAYAIGAIPVAVLFELREQAAR